MTRFSFEVQGNGIEEIANQINRLADTEGRVILNDGLRDVGRVLVPSKGTGPMASATPKGATGKLARSTFFQITGPVDNPVLEILQPARTPSQYGGDFYGRFVREGTRPHRIEPRIKRVLKFEINEQTIFSRGVNHPGNAPNPYPSRVLQQVAPQIQQVVNRIGQRLVATVS